MGKNMKKKHDIDTPVTRIFRLTTVTSTNTTTSLRKLCQRGNWWEENEKSQTCADQVRMKEGK